MRPSRLLLVAGLLTVLALLTPSLASADTSSTLTVVGTSDVSDSGLVQNLIQPEFHAEYPQFTFKYVGSASGTAIGSAMNGTGGPSVLIVHAASLENTFVSGGFSYPTGAYGNAIFTNDFVVIGPTKDPAGVSTNAANNAARSFADIAAAGVAGKVTFLTRGGTTTASGTTVEEHAIWALVYSSGLTPSGVVICDVSAADGGGMSPISTSKQSTSGQPCPDSGTVSGTDAPTWYDVNSMSSQGANVIATNTCNVPNSGTNTCYTLSDRGTYDYLSSGQDPAGTIPNLTILTRDNSASAPGGADALINYFHAYIINPAKTGETVNLTAAQDFVSFLTSPGFQAQLKTYLDVFPYPAPAQDADGAPFKADASPSISVAGFPAIATAGSPVTVTGTVTNNEPGYPAIANQTVTLDELAGGIPVPVGTSTTTSTGAYSISFTPSSAGQFQVSTGNISQVENGTLSPVFGDILSPAASQVVTMGLQGAVTLATAKAASGGAAVTGLLSPAAPNSSATVSVLARTQGSTGAYSVVGGTSLTTGQTAYAANATLKPGKYQLETTYQDPGAFLTATSTPQDITVANPSLTAAVKKITVKKGEVTITGTLSSAPTSSGAKVELEALRTGKLAPTAKKKTSKSKKSIRTDIVARIAAASFKQVGKTSVGSGKTKFTIKVKLTRGYSYVLQLKFVKKGSTTTYSKVSTLKVK